jgi:hypothetical protein
MSTRSAARYTGCDASPLQIAADVAALQSELQLLAEDVVAVTALREAGTPFHSMALCNCFGV